MRILGISSGGADAAAALVEEGAVRLAAAEERYSRVARDGAFPERAIQDCLATAGGAVDVVVVHQKPWSALGRRVAEYRSRGLAGARRFVSETPAFLREELVAGQRAAEVVRRAQGRRPEVAYAERVESHCSAAFLASPFRSAAVLVVGAVGEWATAATAHGVNHRLDVLEEQRYPDSLAELCDAVRRWCGLPDTSDLGDLARLAAAGEPSFAASLARFAEVLPDGSVRVDARALDRWGSPGRPSRRLVDLFGGPPTQRGGPWSRRDADLACSFQQLLEQALVAMAGRAHRLTGESHLCLGGALASDPVANAAILRDGPFDRLWVPPDAGTGGTAVGAALWCWHSVAGMPRAAEGDDVEGAEARRLDAAVVRVGPEVVVDTDATDTLRPEGDPPHRPGGAREVAGVVAAHLLDGARVGWVAGRMELGPLALGGRCILRAVEEQPVAPLDGIGGSEVALALADRARDHFDLTGPETGSRSVAAPPRGSSLLHAVPILDADDDEPADRPEPVRIHAVDPAIDPLLHAVLTAVGSSGGRPLLLCSPLAVVGGPIARSTGDARAVARERRLDLLVVDGVVVEGPFR